MQLCQDNSVNVGEFLLVPSPDEGGGNQGEDTLQMDGWNEKKKSQFQKKKKKKKGKTEILKKWNIKVTQQKNKANERKKKTKIGKKKKENNKRKTENRRIKKIRRNT